MNNVTLIGRLTDEPKMSYYQNTDGTQGVVSFITVAVDRDQERTDFIKCKAFSGTAELLQKYFHKGNKIGVTGSIQTGSYTDKGGATVYTTDVLISRVDFCESAQRVSAADPETGYKQQQEYYENAQPQQVPNPVRQSRSATNRRRG